MRSNLKPLLILTVLFLLPFFISSVKAASEDTATLAITQAEETVATAYEAVLEAERAGAEVSRLLDQLNNASKYLAEVQMLYRLRDFDGAVDSANTARGLAEEVMIEAEKLKIDAHESWIAIFLIRIIGSIVGVIAVVFGTFIAWRVFKKRYFRQVEKMERKQHF